MGKIKRVDEKVENSRSEISKTQGEILYGLSKFLSISDIARHKKVSKQAIYKGIKILIRKGLIQKRGMAYGLTEKGNRGLTLLMGLTYKQRQHNIHIKIKVLESQRNWDKKRNMIIQLPYFNKRIRLKNNYYDLLTFGKVGIKTTSKSVIFLMPTLFDSTIEGAVIQMMEILFTTIPKVENRFKIKLMKDDKLNMTIISQEYARLNDAIAKIYKKEDNKLYVTDDKGELRFIADYSFAVNEFEAVHPNKASDDMDAVHPFLLDLANNPTTFSEVRGVVTEVLKVQQMQSYNIVKHQKVLDEMLITLKKIQNKL